MKRIVSLFLMVAVCITMLTVSAHAVAITEPNLMMGDVDVDGRVGASDALVVLGFTVYKYSGLFTDPPLPDESHELYRDYKNYYHFVERFLADVDGDGMRTAEDALYILKYTVGKIKEFPVADITQAVNYDKLPAWPGDVQ